jgi:hypothetical protein
MDDILILTKTRWQNRKAIIQLNQILSRLRVEKHPDKAYIGKIENGFIPGILPSTLPASYSCSKQFPTIL